jgi:hypothetical protein
MLRTEWMRYKGWRDSGRVFQEGNGNGHASHFAPRARARRNPVDRCRLRGAARSTGCCIFHNTAIAFDCRGAARSTRRLDIHGSAIAFDCSGTFQCPGSRKLSHVAIASDCVASSGTTHHTC